jgi:HEAT repeat protein
MSMTAAGVGSLLLCRRQLERYRAVREGNNPLLVPLTSGNPYQDYKVSTSFAAIDQAVKAGMAWLTSNFTTTNTTLIGQSVYYGLYGIERVAALSNRQTLGASKGDLLEKGRAFIRSSQRPDGSWIMQPYTDDVNTVWALLYLTKSTTKSLKRVATKKLGAGTLIGGRYLPKDLTTMTVADGRVMSRPMNGAVEGMLAAIEDPRTQNLDSAVSGLIERYEREGPEVLRPFKDRFRKMLTDRDANVRQAAAWSLARTGDLDVIPDLIAALVDGDDQVVSTSRMGLQLLSRKIDGLGPPEPATPEERQEAAKKWRAWYDAVRPLEASVPEDDIRKPVRRALPGTPPVDTGSRPARSPVP